MKTVLLFVFLLSSWVASAQINPTTIPPADGQKTYMLLLKDGSVVSGRIVRRDSSNLVVRQRNGRLTYVDLELFDRVITTPLPDSQPINTITAAPLTDTNGTENNLILFKDGSRVRGRIVRRDSTMLVIRKRGGELTYADPALLETVINPRLLTVNNPFAPFMTLNQTAYTVEPGRLYYRNVWLVYNEFNLGLTRNWSIGASVVPINWLITDSWYAQRSVGLSSKLSFPLGDLARIGASVEYQPSGTYEFFKVNALWNIRALASLGDSQRNVTIGYGRASSGNNKLYRQPYFTVSALLKLTPQLSFITDNTLYTNQNRYISDVASVFSAAFRFDRPRHAFDLGILGQTYNVSFFQGNGRNPQFFPYLAYNLRIGQ